MFQIYFDKLSQATLETIYLTAVSTFFVAIFGIIWGILLFITSKGEILENKYFYGVINIITSIFRAIPFFILIILLLPVTKIIMGTILGSNAAFPALILSVTPFYARVVETSFKEVDRGVIEAAKAYGATDLQIILKILIPESIPNLLSNLTTLSIAIVGYTAMAGVIGAGGLGNLAFIEGFQRNNMFLTALATIDVVILVFIIQAIGNFVVSKISYR
ncbi:Methionine import system permease protein MetP [Candidatus Hepatincola sp. Pdp]